MSIVINEEIAPDIARAIIARAALHGLSVNDYLRQLLGFGGCHSYSELPNTVDRICQTRSWI
jgi:hypothetical protein